MSRPHHKDGKKPIAEVSSGSVTIPIYASPVTIKIGKKPSPNSEADSKLNGDGSERKTYTSFKVVYYEGTQRVFRRSKPNVRAEDGRLMNRFAFPPEKLHIASFNTVGTLLKPRHWSAAGVQHMLKSIGASGGTIYSSNAAIMLASRFDLEAETRAPDHPRCDMHRAGHVFRCSANGVWLVNHVPPEFIDFSKTEFQPLQNQTESP